MLNKQDKKYISDTFDQKFDEKFDEKFDKKFDEKFDEKMAELRTKLNSDMFNYMDPFLQEIRALREETTIQFHRVSGHTDQLENHEERIDSLEKKLAIN
ncbi:hypothetical protein KKE34_02245 [Patescibacteria group bacterium]|nr:hypothetical protein [Patescibacteria group bacterium]MBU1885407.1 hypothetical protein [Patescibacteria group bacterium]